MTQRTDTQVPHTDRSVGTDSESVQPAGMDPGLDISVEEFDVLHSMLQVLSNHVDLEDPQLLVGLSKIGQVARRLCANTATFPSGVGTA